MLSFYIPRKHKSTIVFWSFQYNFLTIEIIQFPKCSAPSIFIKILKKYEQNNYEILIKLFIPLNKTWNCNTNFVFAL